MTPLVVFTEGRFGAAVGEIVARRTNAGVHGLRESRERLADIVAGARFVAVALWRLYERECMELDTACARAGVPWSCAYMMEERLYCGPLMVPGRGPCFSCFRRRYLTHRRSADRELALLQAYARDPEMGPPGFVGPMAWIAASALLADSREVETAAGRLRRLNLCTGGLADTEILPVHGCPTCMPSKPVATGDRFVSRLVPLIEEILG
jgi:bacteriocin biosynthesis cyclodehydratase domain-containing protein